MRATLLAVLAVAAFAVTACDAPKEPAAPAAAAPAAAPPPPAPEPTPEPAATVLPGLSAPWATEAEWVASCAAAQPPIPESVCTCSSKAFVKEIGADGLYNWVYEWFINRNGMGQARGKNWMEANGHDSTKQQKVADAIRKCYA